MASKNTTAAEGKMTRSDQPAEMHPAEQGPPTPPPPPETIEEMIEQLETENTAIADQEQRIMTQANENLARLAANKAVNMRTIEHLKGIQRKT